MASGVATSCCAATSWNYGHGEAHLQRMLASAKRVEGLLISRHGSMTNMTAGLRKIEKWSGRPIALKMESTGTAIETKKKMAKKKMAKLCVKKSQTIPLPSFSDASGNPQHLSVFLREPEGRQSMLNTKTLRMYEDLGNGVFRCYLPTMEFLNFAVAPVIDLQVDATEESCQVDLLSCKFEGSNLVRSQNDRFSASLKNHLSWSTTTEEHEQNLHIRLELNVSLEVYTLPFTILPISAVETPGTLILQALVDRLLPLFLDQLFTDYQAWAEAQCSRGDGDEIARIEDLEGDKDKLNISNLV